VKKIVKIGENEQKVLKKKWLDTKAVQCYCSNIVTVRYAVHTRNNKKSIELQIRLCAVVYDHPSSTKRK